jgi:uncharacterized membrane protein
MGQTQRSPVSLPVDPERAWLATFLVAVAGAVAGSVLFTELVYDRFIWRHFLGRMVVDGRNARCAARVGGETRFVDSLPAGASSCFDGVFPAGAVVANEQYTLLSEVGYIAILLFFLVGVVMLLVRLDVGTGDAFFYSLVPYAVFGSGLRVVEDASNAAEIAGASTLLPYPWNLLVVSPIIYFSGAALTMGVIVAAVALERRGVVDDYARLVAGVGVALLAGVLVVLGWLAATTTYVSVHPWFLVLTLLGSTVLAVGMYYGLERRYPSVLAGTGAMSLVVFWAHAVDGVANVLALDWWASFGLQEYFPKHPVNQFIVDVTASTMPASVTGAIGTAWPFLLVKLVAAALVVWVFDEPTMTESPRYARLLLVAVVVVGLGPGARDMLRATFGV